MAALFEDGSDSSDDSETAALLLSSTKGHAARQVAFRSRPTLSFISIATITYFSVSGGPFGLEIAVAAAGPAAIVAMLLLFTVIWALPCALMTAELSSALPSRAGYMHWVDRGMGPMFGGLNGWLGLLGSAVDSSTYPSICCDYLVFALNHWGSVPGIDRGLLPSRATLRHMHRQRTNTCEIRRQFSRFSSDCLL